jgi:hypothetical protein
MAEKRPKKENPVGLAIFCGIMLLIAVGLLIIFREPKPNGSSEKAETPSKTYFTYPTYYKEYVMKYAVVCQHYVQ